MQYIAIETSFNKESEKKPDLNSQPEQPINIVIKETNPQPWKISIKFGDNQHDGELGRSISLIDDRIFDMRKLGRLLTISGRVAFYGTPLAFYMLRNGVFLKWLVLYFGIKNMYKSYNFSQANRDIVTRVELHPDAMVVKLCHDLRILPWMSKSHYVKVDLPKGLNVTDDKSTIIESGESGHTKIFMVEDFKRSTVDLKSAMICSSPSGENGVDRRYHVLPDI